MAKFVAINNGDGTATIPEGTGFTTCIIDEDRTPLKDYEDHICLMDHPEDPEHTGTWWLLSDKQ